MIGNRNCLSGIRRTSDALTDRRQSIQPGCYRSAASNPARVGPIVAATLLLFALALQCFDLRAELQFRSSERKDGQQHWSALKNYTNPADIAYPRTLADGTQVPAEEVQVFLHGYITAEDVNSAKVMESLLKKGRQKIAGNTVSFASNGGEVDAAMELGRLLRRLGVSTLVAREDQCMSSCVFAFMGGDQRTAAGRIGIHRPYFSSTREVADRRILYRQLQKKLQEYIEELDFPPSLYEAVMAVPPETLSVLAPADLKRFYLEGMSPSTQDEVDAASARKLGISVLEYFERKTAGNSNSAGDPGRQQKDPPGARAASGVAGQKHAEPGGSGASRSVVAGSPRASF
jgi:ATP-dependent protease ClpP protease subunit